MSYKIFFCEPGLEKTEASPYWDWWKKIADTVLSSDIVLEFGGLRKACMGLSTFDQSYNGVQMAQRAYEAEKQGYDAFIIGCASDMGLKECRGIVNIPVIAPTEATALYASTLGTKFSIIDLQPFTKPSIENVVANAVC
jgi:Asp/Glu/hydantoin racemase